MDTSVSLSKIEKIRIILQLWEKHHNEADYNPILTLKKLAKIVELEKRKYLGINPDPSDTQHPCLSHPESSFGRVLNTFFENEHFMTTLVSDYLCDTYSSKKCGTGGDIHGLNIEACRLMIDILPALETSVIFQADLDGLIHHLFSWLEESSELLQSCATILLAFAMKNPERATKFRLENGKMVPMMLGKLHELKKKTPKNCRTRTIAHPFATFVENRSTLESVKIHPPSGAMQQMLILRYLTTMGKYEEYLNHVIRGKALGLILNYIKPVKIRDERLTFEAIKYLGSLLCHSPFVREFKKRNGLYKLLHVRSPNRREDVAEFQSVFKKCDRLYWEDAMEGISLLPKHTIRALMILAKSLLTKNIDYGKLRPAMFLGFSCSFKVLFDEFDAENCLREIGDAFTFLRDDEKDPSDNFVKFIAATYARYLKAYVYFKTEPTISHRVGEISQEEVYSKFEVLHGMITDGSALQPIEEIRMCEGFNCIFMILEYASCSREEEELEEFQETIGYFLDIIAISSLHLTNKLLFSDPLHEITWNLMPMELLLYAAEGKLSVDSHTRKTALRSVINCISEPINIVEFHAAGSTSDALMEKIWDGVRSCQGIMILLRLITAKDPITDADKIRALACQALCGLAKYEKVRQILGKLPIFVDGEIQKLMEKPIRQENQREHLEFRENARELIERVTPVRQEINLFEPNECPNPKKRKLNEIENVTSRVAERQWSMRENRKLDRRLIYSQFRPMKNFTPTEIGHGMFTCCIYSPCERYLMIGTQSGRLIVIDANSGIEEANDPYHNSCVNRVECNRIGNLILTSTDNGNSSIGRSVLCKIESSPERKMTFRTVESFRTIHTEFSKLQDKIVGTSTYSTQIYDVETGRTLLEFRSPSSRWYKNNRATFSMNDELVLNEGCLWDVKSKKRIYRFDRFNDLISGIFHPNGNEIVSNTQVWDLRTFHLLKTVPNLDRMQLEFSSVYDIIYAHSIDKTQMTYPNSLFQTFDALDYESIATHDVNGDIYSLSCNKLNTQIAIVENSRGTFGDVQKSCVNIYDVGRCGEVSDLDSISQEQMHVDDADEF